MLLCYELHMAALAQPAGGASAPGPFPPLAEFQKVERMYAHLEDLLQRIGFLDPKNPKRIMHTMRRVFGRRAFRTGSGHPAGNFPSARMVCHPPGKKKGHVGLEFFRNFLRRSEKVGRLHGRKPIAKLIELPLGGIKTALGLLQVFSQLPEFILGIWLTARENG